MYGRNFSKHKTWSKSIVHFLSIVALLTVIMLLLIYGSMLLKIFAGLALGVSVLSFIFGKLLLKITDDYYKINAAFWDALTGFVLAPYLYLLGAIVPISIMVLVKVPAIYIKIIVLNIIILPPILYAFYLLQLLLREHKMTLWQFLTKKVQGKTTVEIKQEIRNHDRIELLYARAAEIEKVVNAKLIEAGSQDLI